MKKLLIVAFLLFSVLPLMAQIQQAGDKGLFFNNSTVTLKNNKVLKIDTTMAVFVKMDTCNSVYTAHDTSGNKKCSTNVILGTKNLKALMTDTLQGNPGGPFFVAATIVANSSTDSLFIYGRRARNPMFSRFDSVACGDTIKWTGTVTPANSQRWSQYLWTRIDSFKIRTGAAGLDSIYTWTRPFFAMTLADSNTDLASGVLLGGNTSGTNDSVQTLKWGYYVKRGMTQVYASGNTVRIKAGDPVQVGNNGKVIPVTWARLDTLLTAASTFGLNRRYVPGASKDDYVFVSPRGRIASATDTLGHWRGYATNDSIWVVSSAPQTLGATGYIDSLNVLYIPKGALTSTAPSGNGNIFNANRHTIGRAMQQCTQESTKIWIDFQP